MVGNALVRRDRFAPREIRIGGTYQNACSDEPPKALGSFDFPSGRRQTTHERRKEEEQRRRFGLAWSTASPPNDQAAQRADPTLLAKRLPMSISRRRAPRIPHRVGIRLRDARRWDTRRVRFRTAAPQSLDH